MNWGKIAKGAMTAAKIGANVASSMGIPMADKVGAVLNAVGSGRHRRRRFRR